MKKDTLFTKNSSDNDFNNESEKDNIFFSLVKLNNKDICFSLLWFVLILVRFFFVFY
jgi:hypothetical protein